MRSRLVPKIVIAALAAGAVLSPARESQAFDPATATAVIGILSSAYSYYQKAMDLLNGSGPDLAAKLDQVQANILAALATQRNQQWRANAQTVFDNFKILGYRMPEDPNNPALWSSTIELSKSTINLYAQLVDDVTAGVSSDVDSNYQLAPMFNTLVATHIGLDKMKGEIYPGNPATWGESNIYLARAMAVDYSLVGATNYLCWPGFNPGSGSYWWINANKGRDPGTHDAQAHSQFYKKLANRDVQVGTWTGTVYGSGSNRNCTSSTQTLPKYCNPYKGTCTPLYNAPVDSRLICPTAQLVFPTTASEAAAGLLAARNYAAANWWNPDQVVQVANAGIKGMMTVGGGQESDGASVTLPVIGQMTDPQVYEPACNGISGGFTNMAYPMSASAPLPRPVSFADGFQQEGDSTNIFPHNQVRMWNGSGLVARTNPLFTSVSHNYTLILRYTQPHSGSGIIKVGIQRGDTGATELQFNNVSFDPTPNAAWELKRINFTSGSAWPNTAYVRLQYMGGFITYLDAVWLEDQ